jgi:hypothetical protein
VIAAMPHDFPLFSWLECIFAESLGPESDSRENAMPFAPFAEGRPVEFFILHDAKADGPCLGRYGDKEIPASVIDGFGRRYTYVGVAPRKSNGRFDVDALQDGEFILPPGLVYRINPVKPGRLASLFRLH